MSISQNNKGNTKSLEMNRHFCHEELSLLYIDLFRLTVFGEYDRLQWLKNCAYTSQDEKTSSMRSVSYQKKLSKILGKYKQK